MAHIKVAYQFKPGSSLGPDRRLSSASRTAYMLQPMDDGTKTVLERAFELARSGRFANASDVKRALAAEGYSVAQFTGRTLSQQLRAAIEKAKGREDPGQA